jgi:CheY-like chemotaxis protein
MSAKILIVDDEPPIIEVLRYNLRQAQYEVVAGGYGLEALDWSARVARPDHSD